MDNLLRRIRRAAVVCAGLVAIPLMAVPRAEANDLLYVPWSSALPGWSDTYTPSSDNDCAAGRPSCLGKTLKELARIHDLNGQSCSHNAVFSLAYLRMTQYYGHTRDMPGYYLSTSRQAFELIDAAGVPNLYYQYDVYHMQIMEGDLATTIERRLPRIGHVQIADPPARNEPGTGEVNFRFLLRHLDRLGYAGWIGCEYRPRAGTVAGLGWMEEFR